jgi:hypothetical protein
MAGVAAISFNKIVAFLMAALMPDDRLAGCILAMADANSLKGSSGLDANVSIGESVELEGVRAIIGERVGVVSRDSPFTSDQFFNAFAEDSDRSGSWL